MTEADLIPHIPGAVIRAIRAEGLHKVASRLYGVTEIDYSTISRLLSADLVKSAEEARQIRLGILAFETIRG